MLEILDVPDSPDYSLLWRLYYRSSDCVSMFYEASSKESLQKLQHYITGLSEIWQTDGPAPDRHLQVTAVQDTRSGKGAPRNEEAIKKGQQLASDIGASFSDYDFPSEEGIDRVIEELARSVLIDIERREEKRREADERRKQEEAQKRLSAILRSKCNLIIGKLEHLLSRIFKWDKRPQYSKDVDDYSIDD